MVERVETTPKPPNRIWRPSRPTRGVGALSRYMQVILDSGLGSDLKVTVHKEMRLKDNTRAYRSEVQWVYLPAGVELMTQVVAAYRGDKVVWVTAHPRSQPERVSSVVESLRFE